MPRSTIKKSSKSNKKKNVKMSVILGGLGLFILTYIFLLTYTPRSTLRWEEKPEGSPSLGEACKDQPQLYPRSLHTWAFPAFSPNGKYYIDIAGAKLGRTKMLKLFIADTNQEVGRYYSAYSSLFIFCWAEDSSGIYVADREPGGTGFGIFTPPGKIGPVKKLLVPE